MIPYVEVSPIWLWSVALTFVGLAFVMRFGRKVGF